MTLTIPVTINLNGIFASLERILIQHVNIENPNQVQFLLVTLDSKVS